MPTKFLARKDERTMGSKIVYRNDFDRPLTEAPKIIIYKYGFIQQIFQGHSVLRQRNTLGDAGDELQCR